MAALDIKDAFLQAPQDEVIHIELQGRRYQVLRNLPGQRLGAKRWYWHCREYISKSLKFEWCREQPCTARCIENGVCNCFLLRVNDLLFIGSQDFWEQKFLPCMTNKFSVSCNMLEGDGSSISFLKRRIVKLSDGLLLIPGTPVMKVIDMFEKSFGKARAQKVPCDGSIQQTDQSAFLSPMESSAYRSIVGLLLYLARERVDIMFTVKELSSTMSKPTTCSLQHMRKLVGYLRQTGDYGLLFTPEFGSGKLRKGTDQFWLLMLIGQEANSIENQRAAQFTS